MLSRNLLHVWLLLFGCAFADTLVMSHSQRNIQSRFKGFDQVMSCLNANISSLKENNTWQANSEAQLEAVNWHQTITSKSILYLSFNLPSMCFVVLQAHEGLTRFRLRSKLLELGKMNQAQNHQFQSQARLQPAQQSSTASVAQRVLEDPQLLQLREPSCCEGRAQCPAGLLPEIALLKIKIAQTLRGVRLAVGCEQSLGF
jgi:hypothetical protein